MSCTTKLRKTRTMHQITEEHQICNCVHPSTEFCLVHSFSLNDLDLELSWVPVFGFYTFGGFQRTWHGRDIKTATSVIDHEYIWTLVSSALAGPLE